ncbi:MAG: hypothetical protein HY703_10500 [Gemmatimonadetes bacterium]|nr:hypothetical protein [Gemmatimonadota bacterium]
MRSVWAGLQTAVVVGASLSVINHPELLRGRLHGSMIPPFLKFAVPFLVAVHSRWRLSREWRSRTTEHE